MFGRREGRTANGLCWETKDEIYYLKKILESQNEILNALINIDNRILNYFGDDTEKKKERINEAVRNGHFKESQRDVLFEIIKLSRDLPDECFGENNN